MSEWTPEKAHEMAFRLLEIEEHLTTIDKNLEIMVRMLNRLYEKVQGLEGEPWVTPELNRDWK